MLIQTDKDHGNEENSSVSQVELFRLEGGHLNNNDVINIIESVLFAGFMSLSQRWSHHANTDMYDDHLIYLYSHWEYSQPVNPLTKGQLGGHQSPSLGGTSCCFTPFE